MRGGFHAVEELTEIYNRIYRYCFYKVRNSAAAEDLTQEAFLRYFSGNKRLKRGEDTAYLYTIAKNLCTDYFRKRRTEELPEDYPTEDFADNSETKIAVRTAMDRLDERRKEVILLRYIGGLSVNETAEAMEISRFAVHRLERAALAEMKTYLKGAF
ncbi:MAG: RNA polymerase sigma factor [Prevotella sp.]|nr:RNA polymerase sigma factor [Prevotella sp.]